jgi:quinoprotein glucose dehydrogenase
LRWTGKKFWHFQTVHHDLWDYDLPQAPKLLTLDRGGKRIEAVAVAGKTGFIYTFDRRTGRPVFPIEERPVPKSDIPGEEASPTQPFPTAPEPFVRQHMTAADLNPYLDAAERKQVAAVIAGLRNEGIFTPPSRQGTLQIPGSSGGTNWGNGAVDPRTGRFFVVGMDVPAILRMEPPSDKPRTMFLGASAEDPGGSVYAQNCSSCHGEKRAGQPPAIPALTGIAARRTVYQVSEIVTRGRAVMPAFNLKPQEMKDLLLFLGFSREQASKASAPPPAAGPDVQDGSTAAAKSGPIKLKTGYNFLFSKKMFPANATPWSTLTAYDMNSGRKLWQVPFGELPGLKNSGALFPRGTIVATAGDLLFAGTQDRKLRAWSMVDGRMVWQAPLPSVPGGVPAVYKSGGRQFIALAAGSYDPAIAKMSSVMTEGRNSIVAFALPKK